MKPLVKEFWTLKEPARPRLRGMDRYWFIDEVEEFKTQSQAVKSVDGCWIGNAKPVKIRVTIEEIEV